MALLLYGCAATKPVLPPNIKQQRVANLAEEINALGDEIDPEEAQRAARIAIDYSKQLAIEYDIAGSALYHNLLVNLGARERGLCVHWTADLITRLHGERFQTLDLHWGIANYNAIFSIEHSTVIVSAPGDSLQQGLVLDPWRNSGDLYWSLTIDDEKYDWEPQAEVHALKRSRKAKAENHRLVR
jgi:hypothetical protein